MKRKFVIFIGGAALVCGIMINLSLVSNKGSLSDLALANIEVLAKNEGGPGTCSQSTDSWTEELGCKATWFSCNAGDSDSCKEGLYVICPDGSSTNDTNSGSCGGR